MVQFLRDGTTKSVKPQHSEFEEDVGGERERERARRRRESDDGGWG